jgi:hypothetical protein
MGRSRERWRSWNAEEVGEWLKTHSNLTRFAPAFVKAEITGSQLPELDAISLEG